MRLFRAAERVARPWRNGGGVTREVAAWPPGSGFETFDWRVSMAQVRADGPFSTFPGIDRTLAVLEGRLRLEVEGSPPVVLARDTAPANFPGDRPTQGRVEAGPVLDLNVMTRRGRVLGRLRRLEIQTSQKLEAAGRRLLVLVLAPETPIRLVGRMEVLSLGRHDAALLEDGEDWRLEGPALAYVASFEAA